MPGSPTTPGRQGARVSAPFRFAFRQVNSVSTRDSSIVAQWLAYTLPCRRFADILADDCARLGADVVRYTFIAVDLHLLLLADFYRRTHFSSVKDFAGVRRGFCVGFPLLGGTLWIRSFSATARVT